MQINGGDYRGCANVPATLVNLTALGVCELSARILIADDDDLLVRLVKHKLSARGYDVSAAADGERAFYLIGQEKPDLIVLDAMMPVMDGFEVLRRVKKDPLTRSIPVVMLTARNQESDIVAALNNGAEDYLVKPFLPEELVLRIGKALMTTT
ncbi:MAG TPA: response regulator [Stellaceae bacterium]|nr:response regulator [Stellaceae bacterium]